LSLEGVGGSGGCPFGRKTCGSSVRTCVRNSCAARSDTLPRREVRRARVVGLTTSCQAAVGTHEIAEAPLKLSAQAICPTSIARRAFERSSTVDVALSPPPIRVLTLPAADHQRRSRSFAAVRPRCLSKELVDPTGPLRKGIDPTATHRSSSPAPNGRRPGFGRARGRADGTCSAHQHGRPCARSRPHCLTRSASRAGRHRHQPRRAGRPPGAAGAPTQAAAAAQGQRLCVPDPCPRCVASLTSFPFPPLPRHSPSAAVQKAEASVALDDSDLEIFERCVPP